jgi:predicted transposase YbfD/YdcC
MEPLEADLPCVSSLVVVHKTSSTATEPEEETASYYLSSRLPGPAEEFARAIGGHWGGSEIRNHWVRDALWAEDKTRSKHWHLNANLAVLRAGLIALRAQAAAHWSWPALFEHCAHKPSLPFHLVTQPHAT